MLNIGNITKHFDGDILDEYGYLKNTEDSINLLVMGLKHGHSIMFCVTDKEEESHYDVVLNYGAFLVGDKAIVQRGIKYSDLFVSVMNKGSFGFETGRDSHTSYYSEKLGVACEPLTEILNALRLKLK